MNNKNNTHFHCLNQENMWSYYCGIMREIVFQLLVAFYYRISLIFEQKYRDTDKSIKRGKQFNLQNDNAKLIVIKYRDKVSR